MSQHYVGLRHGESEYNLLGLCNDDLRRQVPLTVTGRSQAMRAIASLRHMRIVKIISSPLLRAQQTAEIIANGLGLKVETDDRLNDIRSGCDGLPVSQYLNAIAADPLNLRVGDGETLLEFHERINLFLSDLSRKNERIGAPILLVAHEETMRVFKAKGDGLLPKDFIGLSFANCEIYSFYV